MHRPAHQSTNAPATGLVIHGAARYDFLVWLFTLGGEKRLRERMLRLARLQPGEDVLDVGCGTGSLAILAKRQVGEAGIVHGLDAAPEMIARARAKARRARVDVHFAEAPVQALPLADSTVDVVLSTLMLHHVPRKALPQIAREIKRVLRPTGRFLAVDFTKPTTDGRSFIDRFHRHGFIRLDDIIAELQAAGFGLIHSGPVGAKNLHFVLAAAEPAAGPAAEGAAGAHSLTAQAPAARRARRHRGALVVAAAAAGLLAVVGLHLGAALSLGELVSDLSLAGAGALALLIVAKVGLLGWGAHQFGAGVLNGWLGVRDEHIDDK